MKRPLPTIVNFTTNKLTENQKHLGFYDIPDNYIKMYEAKYQREVLQRKSLKEILVYIFNTKCDTRKHLGLTQLVNLAGTVEAMAILFNVPEDIFLEIENAFSNRQVYLFNDINIASRWIQEETERLSSFLPPVPQRRIDKNTIKRNNTIDGFFDPDAFSDIADVF